MKCIICGAEMDFRRSVELTCGTRTAEIYDCPLCHSEDRVIKDIAPIKVLIVEDIEERR